MSIFLSMAFQSYIIFIILYILLREKVQLRQAYNLMQDEVLAEEVVVVLSCGVPLCPQVETIWPSQERLDKHRYVRFISQDHIYLKD